MHFKQNLIRRVRLPLLIQVWLLAEGVTFATQPPSVLQKAINSEVEVIERIEKGSSANSHHKAKTVTSKAKLNSNHKGMFTNMIIHLYKQQFVDLPTPFYKEFLQAYEKFFSKEAGKKIPVAARNIDRLELQDAALKVSATLQELYQEFSSILTDLRLPESILFVGDMVTDGHGISVNQNWYLFIDLNTVVTQKRHKSDMKWFLAHELVHAIHYSLNPEFFKGGLLKFMMAEGIATFVSMKICAIPENQALWGGFLADSQILQWRQNAEKNRPIVAKKLEKFISDGNPDPDLDNQLFNVMTMENLEQKRTGYLYGFEIVSKLAAQKTLMQLLKTPYNEMHSQVMNYFSINCKR